jgi:hypothetical protein
VAISTWMEETHMATSTPVPAAAAAEPGVVIAPIPGWALAALFAVAVLALWLVTFDNGQLSGLLSRGDLFFHEFFHDGRHVVGVPCH